MNKLSEQLRKYVRKPLAMLLLVVCSGMLLNAGLYTLKVLPQLASWRDVEEQTALLEKQKHTLEKQPIPAKATFAEMRHGLNQVPIKKEVPRFIIAIKELEKKTKVTILHISISPEAANSELIPGRSSSVPSSAQQVQNQDSDNPAAPTEDNRPSSDSNPASQAAAGNPGTISTITEQQVTITLNGTYSHIVDFLGQLQQLERLVSVKQLQMSPYGQPGTSAVNSGGKSEQSEQFTLTLTCSIYSAEAYLGKFPDSPEIFESPAE